MSDTIMSTNPVSASGNGNAASTSRSDHHHAPIPIFVLVGYLGSGKTTLLNHILHELRERTTKQRQLQQQHGVSDVISQTNSLGALPAVPRVCVLLNEFAVEFGLNNELEEYTTGAVDQDEQQTGHHDHSHDPTSPSSSSSTVLLEEVFEFGSGCVCCSSRGELLSKLADLIPHRHRFDAIILETTGRADPGPIRAALAERPDVSAAFDIARIITVVDAERMEQTISEESLLKFATASGQSLPALTGRKQRDSAATASDEHYKDEVLAQILHGDLIVLNKVSLVTDNKGTDGNNASDGEPYDISQPTPSSAVTSTSPSLPRLRSLLRLINPSTNIIETDYSRAPLQSVLHLEPDWAQQAKTKLPSAPKGSWAIEDEKSESEQKDADAKSPNDLSSRLGLEQASLDHDPSIQGVAVRWPPAHGPYASSTPQPVDADVVLSNLRAFIQSFPRAQDILRIKGMLLTRQHPDRSLVIQGVGRHLHTNLHGSWPKKTEDQVSILVFIGRNVRDLEYSPERFFIKQQSKQETS